MWPLSIPPRTPLHPYNHCPGGLSLKRYAFQFCSSGNTTHDSCYAKPLDGVVKDGRRHWLGPLEKLNGNISVEYVSYFQVANQEEWRKHNGALCLNTLWGGAGRIIAIIISRACESLSGPFRVVRSENMQRSRREILKRLWSASRHCFIPLVRSFSKKDSSSTVPVNSISSNNSSLHRIYNENKANPYHAPNLFHGEEEQQPPTTCV